MLFRLVSEKILIEQQNARPCVLCLREKTYPKNGLWHNCPSKFCLREKLEHFDHAKIELGKCHTGNMREEKYRLVKKL